MAANRKPDFGGYATKAGIKCTDGRTIMPDAFKHMDGMRIPLVWQHGHSDPENVLGHALLEARSDGMYARGYFNNTPKAQATKAAVEHEDINSLSIYANELQEISKRVMHGTIREVSLVLAGANPGAKIDFVAIQHSDDSITELEDEAVITMGLELEHSDGFEEESEETDDSEETDESDDSEETDSVEHADSSSGNSDKSPQDIIDGMSPEQQEVLFFMVGRAMEEAGAKVSDSAEHSDNSAEGGELTHQEGAVDMTRNVFDQSAANKGDEKQTLSHDAMQSIFAEADRLGSLRAAVQKYEKDNLQHGIESIEVLFPDAKAATGVLELEKRRTEWVSNVLNGTRHTPFAKIKTFTADLTQDEARAKGYIKGKYKLEEWIGVTKRTTGPTTIYKKQKLDRDDLIDITDFDTVAFLKGEMRLMTEEEIARAILIGDGRSPVAEDKIKDPLGASDGTGIRSILNDHELFVTTLQVNVDDADSDYEEVVDAVMDGMEFYKGTGTPTLYTTIPQLNKFLKARDGMGRRYYANKQEVADALGVKDIQLVEVMKEHSDLIGIIVNLDDYNVGTDRGGELTMFEDFDIDYNQEKYLLETRLSGALVKPKSALVIKKTAAAATKATPVQPSFDSTTGIVTIPTATGVVYKDSGGATLTAGAQPALAKGQSMMVYATEVDGYYFANNAEDSWTFKRPAA